MAEWKQGVCSHSEFADLPHRCALLNGSLGFVPVVLDVRLGRFNAMVSCVVQVTLCTMGVMRGGFVTPRFVVFGRFPVVPCRVFVMFRRLAVMLCRLFGHISLLSLLSKDSYWVRN